MPYFLLILVVIMFSGNIIIGKAINDLPPYTIAFLRLVVAFIVLLPIGLRSARQYKETFFTYKKPFLIMTLTGITFFNTFIYASLQFTTSTNVSVLETIIPVVTVILSAYILKEKIYKIQWLGVFVSLLGAMWVVMDGNIYQLAAIEWNIGDAIMIGAIATWAIYSIFVKQYMPLFPNYGALLVMSGLSVLVLLPVVILEWIILGVPVFDTGNIAGIFYLGVFPSFLAISMYNTAVDKVGASKSSIFLNLLPVFTMTGASVWLGEDVTLTQVGGAITVIAGVIVTTQGDRLSRRRI
ncbi:DMT family transporter [Salimicrobium album]|uniref:Permease of the drug/metabolite transporter (DMT) superfamily n=1 Tax=Salimicrobium album TaxID=50717 RepID=A0A1H3BL51_9BACI|nr:EamA family transporter [Salimicrobium album]SDX42505.1 Permease of the drug/metabolite transporter (DMT) superfamily [Salimicrobium album]